MSIYIYIYLNKCIHTCLPTPIYHSCRARPYPNRQALEEKLDADRRAERARAVDGAEGRNAGGAVKGCFYHEYHGKTVVKPKNHRKTGENGSKTIEQIGKNKENRGKTTEKN